MAKKKHVTDEPDLASTLFSSAGITPFNIGERNTISSGPDDGTLNKDATVFWNPLRHASSTQLANNLVGGTNERLCNIGAHGNVGFFETGAGQQLPYGPGLYVLTWNQADWLPHFALIKARNYLQMTIWACETGQGQDGADLLFAIATATGCVVRASNGLVLTNGQAIWLQAGAVWVIATPTQRPTPVGPPNHLEAMFESNDSFLLRVNGTLREVPIENVARVRIERLEHLTQRKSSVALSGAVAAGIAWRLFSSKPFKLPGTPAAFVTARAEVTFKAVRGKRPQKRKLVIYNDRLVYDLTSHDAYFARPGSSLPL